jgi:hypothetical protein
MRARGAAAIIGILILAWAAPGSRQFILQWHHARAIADGSSPVTFQAILFEGSHHIRFNYLDVVTGGFFTGNGVRPPWASATRAVS